MRRQYGLFLAALQTLTRVPVPAPYAPGQLRDAARYFPLVGAGIGLPPLAAAALSLAATLLLTGALHEDGLADTADGLLGGRTRDDALRIMRDSRIGAFAALALFTVLAAKLAATAALPGPAWPILAAHAISRAWTLLPAALLPYARADGMAGAIAAPTAVSLAIAALLGLVPLLLLGHRAIPAFLLSAATAAALLITARRRLGGYTGDILGAIQALTELAILLAAAWQPR